MDEKNDVYKHWELNKQEYNIRTFIEEEQVNCHFKLNEIYDNEKIDEMIGKITFDIGKQLSKHTVI
jgi:hypothetical protein